MSDTDDALFALCRDVISALFARKISTTAPPCGVITNTSTWCRQQWTSAPSVLAHSLAEITWWSMSAASIKTQHLSAKNADRSSILNLIYWLTKPSCCMHDICNSFASNPNSNIFIVSCTESTCSSGVCSRWLLLTFVVDRKCQVHMTFQSLMDNLC